MEVGFSQQTEYRMGIQSRMCKQRSDYKGNSTQNRFVVALDLVIFPSSASTFYLELTPALF